MLKWRRLKKISAVDILLIIILTVSGLVLFVKPILKIAKVIIKGALYSALVFGINLVTSAFGVTAGINIITSSMYGILGIYGVLISYISGFLYSLKL